MPQISINGKSTLVQAMAWCHQAPSHYLNQCWSRSIPPYDHKVLMYSDTSCTSPLTYIYQATSTHTANEQHIFHESSYEIHILPKNGTYSTSDLATTDVRLRNVIGKASKKVECGDAARIGASAGDANLPFVVIQWKPPVKNTMRLAITTSGRSILKGQRWDEAKCSYPPPVKYPIYPYNGR